LLAVEAEATHPSSSRYNNALQLAVAVVTLEKESARSMGQREILHVRDMAA